MPSRPVLLSISAALAVALVANWAVSYRTGLGLWLDGAVLQGFTGLGAPRRAQLADQVTSLCDPLPFAIGLLGLVGIALAQRRIRTAVTVALALPAAGVITAGLKQLTAAPRSDGVFDGAIVAQSAWPSGHTTAAMSLALGLVLVSPARLRPLAAAAGGVFAIAVPFAILLRGWHYPSDVLAGYCVSALVLCLALAARPSEVVDLRARLRAVVPPPALAAAGLAAGAALVAQWRGWDAIAYAQAHTSFVVGAVTIAVAALAAATTFAALLRP